MFCPYCGKQTPEEGKFCINCGSNISDLFCKKEDVIESQNDISVKNEKVETESQNALGTFNSNKENTSIETIERTISAEPKKNESLEYIVADSLDSKIPLLNGEKLEHFKEKYLKNGEFVFPVGKYCICYPERIVMNINTAAYFEIIKKIVINEFEKDYSKSVCDLKTFFTDGLIHYMDAINKIADYTTKFFVGSGVMSISDDDIKMGIKVHKRLENKINELICNAEKLYSSAQTENTILEMNNMLAQNNTSYMAGGFGFSGVMGGLAAAGIANVGASVFSSIKENIDKSRIDSKMKKSLDDMFSDESLKDEFVNDLVLCVQDAAMIYRFKMEDIHDGISFGGFYNDELVLLGENTVKYITNKETILENLCKVLSDVYAKPEILKCLVITYYNDKEILQQLTALTEFLLFDSELEDWFKEARKKEEQFFRQEQLKKEEKMKDIFLLPESTVDEVQRKINILIEKSTEIGYDSNEKVTDLQQLMEKLKKEEKEQGLKEALEMSEVTVEDVLKKIERVKEEAEKISYNVSDKIEELYMHIDVLKIKSKEQEYGSILHKVVMEQNVVEHLIDLFAILNSDSLSSEVKESVKCFKSFYKAYLNDKDEIPLLFYDDTLLKSARDSFLLTTKKLLISNSGNIVFVNIEDIYSMMMVEKLISPGILVNDKYKIVMVLAGKEKIRPFIRCLEAALRISKEFSGNLNTEKVVSVSSDENIVENEDVQKGDIKENNTIISYTELFNSVEEIINRLGVPETRAVLFLNGSNSKKYTNAYTNYCKLQENEVPIVLFDNTIFGSAKEGFIMTTKGIHYKNSLSKAEYLQYKPSGNQVVTSGYDIIINGISVSASCASKRENLAEIIEKVINYIVAHTIEG